MSATDCAGNSGNSSLSDAFHIDNTAPEVSTINDGGATCVKSGDEVTITFDVTETNSLQNNPTVKITDASDNQIGTATYVSSSGSTYTYKFTVGTGDYQNCKINVSATDCAGNSGNSSLSDAFHIDNTPPVVSVTAPSSGAYINGTQVISRNLTESNQTTDEARLRWPSGDGTINGNWTTFTSGTTQISALNGWGSIPNGQTFDIEVRHTDCAGNQGTASVTNLTKDVTAPTIYTFTMSCDNASGTIQFSEPVYANNNGTGNLTTTNLSVTKSGGTANINTASISHTAGSSSATVNITWSGTLNGYELVKVETQGSNKVYDAAGNAMVHPTNGTDYTNVNVTIVSNPSDQTVCESSNATFIASATGGAGLNYRWQYSTDGGTNFSDLSDGGSNPSISGSTTTTLTLNGVPNAWNNYKFRIKAYNECDTKYSTAATLTVTPATAITTQPQNTTICYGNSATLSVTAQGGSLSYQWQYYDGSSWLNVSNGTPSGATYIPNNGQSQSLQISGLNAGSYQYRVIVYGSCSPTTVTSNTATVTVNALPTATLSGSTTICSGSSATLTITLTGQSPWTVVVDNYGTINNITSSPYNFNVSPTATTTYTITSVTDGNSCTNTATSNATVTVQPQPTANAGSNGATCVTNAFTVTDATATNYSSVSWAIASGNGSLTNPNTLAPTYTPGSGDAGTTVVLTLTANPISPCSSPATSQKQIYVEGTPVAQTISKSPNASAVCEGTSVSATFSGGSGGNGTDEYDYSFDGSTWYSYTPGSSISTSGKTQVWIRTRRLGTYCSSSSYNTVSWTVEQTPVAPTITKNPNTNSVCQGTAVSATFSGGSGGNGTNTYEYRTYDGNSWSSWSAYSEGNNIATTGLTGVEIRATRNAAVCTPATNTVSWTVSQNELSLTCGDNSTVCSGNTLTLSVTVSGGSGNYSYSWTGPNSFSSNVQNPTRSYMTSADAGDYIVTVTDNNTGCVSSCTTNVTVATTPTIAGQPSDYKVVYNQSANPAFNATTNGATSYQWYKDNDNSGYDGTAISGATNEDYNVSNAQFTDDGYYYLKASNSCGDVYSDYVRLKVAPTQASGISGTRTATTVTLSWTRGNGDGVLVTAKSGTTNTDTPVDGTTYSANSNFSLAPEIGGSGTAKVVYNGTGTSVTVTYLTAGTNYTFCIFEYKNATAGVVYNTNLATNQNRRTIKTLPREITEETIVGNTFAIVGIQPNPVENNDFTLQLYSDIEGTSKVEIVNELGENVFAGAFDLKPGTILIPIRMPTSNGGTPAGTYFLRVTLLGETLIYKFIYLP